MRQSINEDGPTLSRQHSSSPENERLVMRRSGSKNSSGGSLSPASSISLVSLKLSSLSTGSSSSASSTVSSGSTGSTTVRPGGAKTQLYTKNSNNSRSSMLNGSHHHPAAVTANKGTSTPPSAASILQKQQHHHRQQSTGSLKSLHSLTSSVTTTTTSSSSTTTSSSANRRTDNKHQLMGLDDFDIIKTIGTGTFGRVCLVYDKEHREYSALKILQLYDVIRLKQIDHVKNEKNILHSVSHPFVVNLKWHHKDEFNIYMLFEYVCGGELFSYLRNAGHFSSSTSSFYAAEIICALEYLHARNIVYRDLKPENLLLDREGHLKITDFGFAKKLTDRTWTLCGTPEYLAPEIIQSKGHNKAVDWWALGVLIYEMLCGYPPFSDDNNFSTYEKILSGKIDWSKSFDPVAKDLVKKLLTNDRTKRIGCMKNGPEDVKRHRWFRDYDWEDVKNRRLNPPIIPKVSFDGDTRNFDEYPEEESFRVNGITKAQLELFADF